MVLINILHWQILKIGVDGQSRASALTFLYNEGVWPSSAEIQMTGGAAPTVTGASGIRPSESGAVATGAAKK